MQINTQLIFYKTDEVFPMLILMLSKGLKQGLTFNIFFKTREECEAFSKVLWNSSASIMHGLSDDGFYAMQPILITTQESYSNEMKKDCAVFIEQEMCDVFKNKINEWIKICFVNVSNHAYKNIPHKSWQYKDGTWVEVVE